MHSSLRVIVSADGYRHATADMSTQHNASRCRLEYHLHFVTCESEDVCYANLMCALAKKAILHVP
jgi:hypothetical protein